MTDKFEENKLYLLHHWHYFIIRCSLDWTCREVPRSDLWTLWKLQWQQEWWYFWKR